MDDQDDLDDPKSLKTANVSTEMVKPRKKTLVERELETTLTANAISPVTLGDGSSTSRYGRSRRAKTDLDFCDTDKAVSNALKSPKSITNLVKDFSPSSNRDKKDALPTNKEIPTPKLIPVGKPNLKNQIEIIYNTNKYLSRFATDSSNTTPNKTNNLPDNSTSKTYIRKDLIQTNEKKKTSDLKKNMFSPPKKINTHLNNILERSSGKYELSPAKSPQTPTTSQGTIKMSNLKKPKQNITTPNSKPQIIWIKSKPKTEMELSLEKNKSSEKLNLSSKSPKPNEKGDSKMTLSKITTTSIPISLMTDLPRPKRKNPPSLDYILERLSLEKGLQITKSSPRAAAQSAKSIILQKSVTMSPQANCSKNIDHLNTNNSPNAIVINSRGGSISCGSRKSLNTSEPSFVKPVNAASTPISKGSKAKLSDQSKTKSRLRNLDNVLLSQSLDSLYKKTEQSIKPVSNPTKSAGKLLTDSRQKLLKSTLSKSFDNVMVNIPDNTEKFMRLAAKTGRSKSNLGTKVENLSKSSVNLNKTVSPNPVLPSKIEPRNRRRLSKFKPQKTLTQFCQNLDKISTPKNVINSAKKEVKSDTTQQKPATPKNNINLAINGVMSDRKSPKPLIDHADKSSVVKTLDFDCNKKVKKGGKEPAKPELPHNIKVPITIDFNCNKKDKKRSKEPVKPDLTLDVVIEMETKCKYQDGDVAWARMGTFPFWPCLITREPGSGLFVKKKLFGRVERDIVHVTFLGDNGRRNWIVETMLRPFLGKVEFETTRDQFTPEDKKKDPKLYAAFFISEKKLGLWGMSVDEAETLYKAPKESRIEILYELLGLTSMSILKPKPETKKIVRTDSDVSLSASLFETLFSEDDDEEHPRNIKSQDSKSKLDVSEVVTACLDNMAAKTGISKIQRQSHMDIWLQKAKCMTPEKVNISVTVERLDNDEDMINQAEETQEPIKNQLKTIKETKVALKNQQSSSKKKNNPLPVATLKKPYSLRRNYSRHLKTTDYLVNEHDYSYKVDNIENLAGTVNDAVPKNNVLLEAPLHTSDNIAEIDEREQLKEIVPLKEISVLNSNESHLNIDNDLSKMDVEIEVSGENCSDDTKMETDETNVTQKESEEPAAISKQATVPEKSTVSVQETVFEPAPISDPVTFTQPAIVSGQASVSEQGTVSEQAIVSEQATVSEQSTVSDPAIISEQVIVSEQVTITKPESVSKLTIKGLLIEDVQTQITVSQLDDQSTQHLYKIDVPTKKSLDEDITKITDVVVHEELPQVDKTTEKLFGENNTTPIDNNCIDIKLAEPNPQSSMIIPEKLPEDYETPPSIEIPLPEHTVIPPEDNKFNQIIDISLKKRSDDILELSNKDSTNKTKPLKNTKNLMPSEAKNCINNSDINLDKDKSVIKIQNEVSIAEINKDLLANDLKTELNVVAQIQNVKSDSVIIDDKEIDKALESNNNMKEIIADKVVIQDETDLIPKVDHESDEIPIIDSVSVANKDIVVIAQVVSNETNTNNLQDHYTTTGVNETQNIMQEKNITKGFNQTQNNLQNNVQDDLNKGVNHTQNTQSKIAELPELDESFSVIDDENPTEIDTTIKTPVEFNDDLNEIAEKFEHSSENLEVGSEKLEKDNQHEVFRFEVPVVNLDESHSNSVEFFDSIPVTGDGNDDKTAVKYPSTQDHISFGENVKLFDANGIEENHLVRNINDDDETDCEDPMSPTFTQIENFEETMSKAFSNISEENARTSSPTFTQTENFNEGYESPTFTQTETDTFDFDQEVDELGVNTATSIELSNKWNIIPVCGNNILNDKNIHKQRDNMTDVNVNKLTDKKTDPDLKDMSNYENSADCATPNKSADKQDDMEDLFNRIDELCNENDKSQKSTTAPNANVNINIDEQEKSNDNAFVIVNSAEKLIINKNPLTMDKVVKLKPDTQKKIICHTNGQATDEQIELITKKDLLQTVRKTSLRLTRTKNKDSFIIKEPYLNTNNVNKIIELNDTKNNLERLKHNSLDIQNGARDKHITLVQSDIKEVPNKILKVMCERISHNFLVINSTTGDLTDLKTLDSPKLITQNKTDNKSVYTLPKDILTVTENKTINDSDNDSMSSELDNITLSELKVIENNENNKDKDLITKNNYQSDKKNEILTNVHQSDKKNKNLTNVQNDIQSDTVSIQSLDDVSELSDIEGFNVPIKTLKRRSNSMKRLSKILDSRNSSPMTDSDLDLASLRLRIKSVNETHEKVVNACNDSRDSSPDCIFEERNIDTISVDSEEENMPLSERVTRPNNDLRSKKEINKQEPEFLKYLELKQDSLMDEHPEMNKDEIVNYLYKTYKYEESITSEHKKFDDIEPSSLVKGTDFSSRPKKVKKAKLTNKEKSRVINIQKLFSQEIKDKPKRQSAVTSYVDEFSDIEDQIDMFEIFKAKNQTKQPVAAKSNATVPDQIILKGEGNVLTVKTEEIVKISKVKFENDKSANVTFKTETDKPNVEIENISLIETESQTSKTTELLYDEVEEYFKQLTMPKPNVFKGLTREKVCEICEGNSDLVKCKGCNGMFHVKCTTVKEEPEATGLARGRKKKKTRGRKPKGWVEMDDSNSDEKNFEPDVSVESNNSKDETVPIIVILDDFEEQAAEKMKEFLEKETAYESYSSDDGIDWENSVPGKCDIIDAQLKPRSQPVDVNNFKCPNCLKHDTPLCFVCKIDVSPKGQIAIRQRCQVAHCHKYYHIECLELWPQTQFNSGEPSRRDKKISEHFEALTCPRHVCHTCVCDDPRGCRTRFSADKLARCVRCPATYHTFTKCLPAGTQILTASHIICPRHDEVVIRPGKGSCHVNTGWCFICALGGSLICCEYCPTSFHAECLQIKPPEGGYMCEDCETGRLPLYGEMVWVKLGHYRWWPGLILHPCEIPDNIMAVNHSPGDFVVRFFGQYDHYWVNKGRVFPFQEGDSGRISSQKSKIDEAFTLAMEHAHRAFAIVKNAQPNEEESMDIQSSLLPPHYVKLKVNKPCGSLCKKKIDIEESSLTQCGCDPNEEEPCGPYSQCLNRMLLTECGPNCRAGDRCKNRDFEKRNYPKMVPYRTPHRGWGLKTLEPIRAGQFVIEYVGELIDEEEFRRRMQRQHDIRDENFYFLTLDKERMIDAGPKGNLARFMNHCCEPNCETQKWTVLGDVRVGLFAINDIPANTEVNFNYNLECAGIEKKRCMCGAKRCSGYIGAKPKQEEKEVQPKKAKRPYKKKAKIRNVTIQPTPSTSSAAVTPSTSTSNSETPPKRKRGRPRKQRELTEIEKDLLIIKNATNGISSDSESISSLRNETEKKDGEALKRKRVSLSTDELTSYDGCSSPSIKRMKLDEGSCQVGDSDISEIVALPLIC